MISISLPSIHPAALKRTLDNLEATTRCPYEIIVVAPELTADTMARAHVVWVKDESMGGCNAGHAQALTMATGDFILAWVDDHLMVDGWDEIALRDLADCRERSSLDLPYMVGLRQTTEPPQVGTVFGMYYPYFPIMPNRQARNGLWFDPIYRRGFGDADLALRVWYRGGRAEWSSRPVVIVHPDDERKGSDLTTEADMAEFIDRWAPKFGKGWPTATLRDFNIDANISTLPREVRTFHSGVEA
jgi:hypothetical protein